jgi:hypothetical protein
MYNKQTETTHIGRIVETVAEGSNTTARVSAE